jgi:hypothetical protein
MWFLCRDKGGKEKSNLTLGCGGWPSYVHGSVWTHKEHALHEHDYRRPTALCIGQRLLR